MHLVCPLHGCLPLVIPENVTVLGSVCPSWLATISLKPNGALFQEKPVIVVSCPGFHRPSSWVHGLLALLLSVQQASIVHQPLCLRLLHPCTHSIQECGGCHCILSFIFLYILHCLYNLRANNGKAPLAFVVLKSILLHIIVGCDDSVITYHFTFQM